MNLVIDTSVFVSVFGNPDTFTRASQDFFQHIPPETSIVLPTLIVAETIVTIGKQNMQGWEDAYKKLSQSTLIALDEQFLRQILPLIASMNLKASDFIIAATANCYHATLIR